LERGRGHRPFDRVDVEWGCRWGLSIIFVGGGGAGGGGVGGRAWLDRDVGSDGGFLNVMGSAGWLSGVVWM